MHTIDDFTFEEALKYYGASVSAMLIADEKTDTYRALVRRGVFRKALPETGTYTDMVHKLWFHRHADGREISDIYNVFIPNMGKFSGKYSKRIKLLVDEKLFPVQMTILPVDDEGHYLFLLDELDASVSDDETETENKVSSIQNNIYVFTMAFDLVSDTTSSVSLTEISNEPLNYQLKYSDWRLNIVEMIAEDAKETFLKRSDPDYLRSHFKPGDVESFDVMMLNLDGIYQWVKLIFSRMDTTNEDDYRFVYMVQNIHEATISMKATLKHYEELASTDPLTMVFNHGRIETELRNAVEQYKKKKLSASLMVLDIDYFKNVNDQYGHVVGDSTLVHLAKILQQHFSGCPSAVGRWGGEEFVMVIYGETEESVLNIAEELRKHIEAAQFAGVGSVTCSIGVTGLRADDGAESWFQRADRALYSAKDAGRNRVCHE